VVGQEPAVKRIMEDHARWEKRDDCPFDYREPTQKSDEHSPVSVPYIAERDDNHAHNESDHTRNPKESLTVAKSVITALKYDLLKSVIPIITRAPRISTASALAMFISQRAERRRPRRVAHEVLCVRRSPRSLIPEAVVVISYYVAHRFQRFVMSGATQE
jgi:hypothetical protein